jgi:hypothetical protein
MSLKSLQALSKFSLVKSSSIFTSCLYVFNTLSSTIYKSFSYTINVGNGGAKNNNGNNSTAFGATCLGGGSTLYVAWDAPNTGRSGGSGSGGSSGYNQGTGASGGVGVSLKGTGLLSTGISSR